MYEKRNIEARSCNQRFSGKAISITYYTGCPTRYQIQHFFNNANTNEDIATKLEQEYVRCVRNEEECACIRFKFRCNILISGKIIKGMPGSVASGTSCRTQCFYCLQPQVSSKQLTSAVISSEACPAQQSFSKLSHKPHDFRGGNVTEHKMCSMIFSTTFVRRISHSKSERDMIKNVYWF